MSTTTATVTPEQALAWRLDRHLLDPVGSGTVAYVVRRLGAVLAMDAGLAELAVGTRRTSPRPGDLAAARADGTVITVFAFRGSTHHVSPVDGGAYLALRAAGRQWERRSWVEHYRLRPEDWPDFRAAVREALTAGPLTMAELGAAVTSHAAYAHLRPVFDDGAGTLVKPLSWQGDLCFGPSRDGRATFQRLDANPHWAGIPDLEDAGPWAVLAYLRTYGPAGREHVDHWLGRGLSAGKARLDRWWTGLADRLAAVDVGGRTAYVVDEDLDHLLAVGSTGRSDTVRLVPGHDQWVMGPGTSDELVVPAATRDLVTRKANLVLAGGVVRGTWTARGGEVAVTWLDDSSRPDAAIARETERLAPLLSARA